MYYVAANSPIIYTRDIMLHPDHPIIHVDIREGRNCFELRIDGKRDQITGSSNVYKAWITKYDSNLTPEEYAEELAMYNKANAELGNPPWFEVPPDILNPKGS
jgi:hypothetical protein